MTLGLSADEVLTTTRAVRKRLDFDRPVPLDVVRECVEIATQAPTGSNSQAWHFVVVTDEAKRKAIADLYRQAWDMYSNMPEAGGAEQYADDPLRAATQDRVRSSAAYLAEHLHRAPVHVYPCTEGRVDNLPNVLASSILGSVIPAAWSFCLAARERGLGTAWTTLHLIHEKQAAEILGIPYESVSQVALLPVAYTQGTDFKPGPRIDLDRVLHVDTW